MRRTEALRDLGKMITEGDRLRAALVVAGLLAQGLGCSAHARRRRFDGPGAGVIGRRSVLKASCAVSPSVARTTTGGQSRGRRR
jgi:hypothetical protein